MAKHCFSAITIDKGNGRQQDLEYAMTKSLKFKVIEGMAWVSISFLSSRFLGFISTIILARLLSPIDFGLFGIIWVVLDTMETFSRPGMQTAIVQKKMDADYLNVALNTVFITNCLRGFLLFLLTYYSSYWIAYFYDFSKLEGLLKLVSFYFIACGFSNVGLTALQKKLELKQIAIITQVSLLLKITATLVLAFWLRNVWALALGIVLGAVIFSIASYTVLPVRPKAKFSINIAKELFSFGKYIFFINLMIFVVRKGDVAILGKIIGIADVGYYSLALGMVAFYSIDLSKVIENVTFPAFSEIQEDKQYLKKAFLKTVKILYLMIMPLGWLVVWFSPDIIHLIYSDKWAPAIPILEVLAFYGIFEAVNQIFKTLFHGYGAVKVSFYIQVSFLTSFLLLIYPVSLYFGVIGVAYLVLGIAAVKHVVFWRIFLKVFKSSLSELFSYSQSVFCGMAFMSFFLFALNNFSDTELNLLNLLMKMIIALSIYSGSILIIDINLRREIIHIVKRFQN